MLTVVIQAGGESRRMGTDKGLVPFLGRPLIQHVLARVDRLGEEVLVVTNRPEEYAFLNVPLFPDVEPGRGALGGLYTALVRASQPLVAVVACDMPFVSPGLLRSGRDILAREQVDAVIPRTAHGAEPFHAVYRRARCLPPVRAVLEAGRWRADSWYEQAQIHFLDEAAIAPYDPHGRIFMNLNTPEDLKQAEDLARD